MSDRSNRNENNENLPFKGLPFGTCWMTGVLGGAALSGILVLSSLGADPEKLRWLGMAPIMIGGLIGVTMDAIIAIYRLNQAPDTNLQEDPNIHCSV